MTVFEQLILQLLISAGAGAITGLIAWGGFKVELRWLHQRITESTESARGAHERLDRLLENKILELARDRDSK